MKLTLKQKKILRWMQENQDSGPHSPSKIGDEALDLQGKSTTGSSAVSSTLHKFIKLGWVNRIVDQNPRDVKYELTNAGDAWCREWRSPRLGKTRPDARGSALF